MKTYTRTDAGTGREHPLSATDWPDNGQSLTEPERLLLEAMRDHPGRSIFVYQISDYAAIRSTDVADVVASLVAKGFVTHHAGTYQADEHLTLSNASDD